MDSIDFAEPKYPAEEILQGIYQILAEDWNEKGLDAKISALTTAIGQAENFVLSNCTGPSGTTGSAGDCGPTGFQGKDSDESGPTGPANTEQGPTGMASSEEGPKGELGSTGAPGSDFIGDAPLGPKGPAGSTGPAGEDSTEKGPTGPTGPAGVDNGDLKIYLKDGEVYDPDEPSAATWRSRDDGKYDNRIEATATVFEPSLQFVKVSASVGAISASGWTITLCETYSQISLFQNVAFAARNETFGLGDFWHGGKQDAVTTTTTANTLESGNNAARLAAYGLSSATGALKSQHAGVNNNL